MNKALVRRGLPILLAVGLLWYVLKDIPFEVLVRQFRQANYAWLALYAFVFGFYYLTRAARWQLMLAAIGYRPSLFRVTVALLAGTLASSIIAGAGELTRCGTLQRTDGVPIAQGIGSVVAERIVDLIMLIVLIALTFVLEFRRMGNYFINLFASLQARFSLDNLTSFVLFVVISVVVLGLVYWLFRKASSQKHPLLIRLIAISHEFRRGFLGIRQLKQPWLFVGLTVCNYVLIWLSTYILFFASSQTAGLPPTAALTVMTVSSLGGLAVPTQGGLGTYHFLVSRVLMLYGLSATESVASATFMHAVGFLINLVISAVGFLLVPILIAKKHSKR